MRNFKIKSQVAFSICISITTLISTSCYALQKHSPENVLHEEGIDGQEDFSQLNTCAQIRIYTTVGSQFLDRGHFVVILPAWIDEEIAKQPAQDVVDCITKEGEELLNELEPDSKQNKTISLKIHTLVYLAYNSKLLEHEAVNEFVHKAACNPEIWYEYGIVLIYYAQNGYDMKNIPEPDEMIRLICSY